MIFKEHADSPSFVRRVSVADRFPIFFYTPSDSSPAAAASEYTRGVSTRCISISIYERPRLSLCDLPYSAGLENM